MEHDVAESADAKGSLEEVVAAEFVVVIPARFASTRLPGKPLRLIAGKPMIHHVVDRAREAGAAEVVVATDDARIADSVSSLGIEACMTSTGHVSGTDRIAECVAQRGWSPGQIVVNLQGDEPLAPSKAIRAVADCLHACGCEMATLAVPLTDSAQLFDPNCVKLVRDVNGRALYFSRAPLPWSRDVFSTLRADGVTAQDIVLGDGWLRHVGLYAYRAGFLQRFAAMPAGWLEQVESLEQLRALEAGIPIAVAISPVPIPAGVDTEDDLLAVEASLRQQALNGPRS